MAKDIVVGLNVGHDGGVAILVDGRIVAAIGEERLTRQKYTHGYLYALAYCLKQSKISLSKVKKIVFSSYGKSLVKHFTGELKNFGIGPEKCLSVDHHLSHAYGAFCCSSFDEALVVVIDGQGNNNDTESYYLASKGLLEKIGGNDQSRIVAKGIGRTYEAVTNYLGWIDQHAGKTMGLAAYGDPNNFKQPLFELNKLKVEGKLNYKYEKGVIEFAKKNRLDFGPIYSKGTTQQGMDLAAYIQRQTEIIIVKLIKKLVDKTGVKNVCLAGGVALNVNTNSAILNSGIVNSLFILPAASDRGQCLGNAFFGYHQLTKIMPKQHLKNDYFGRIYSSEEILTALEKRPEALLKKTVPTLKLAFEKQTNIAKSAARLINDNKIIAWFQGGSELGPRALGHRSIVCNPKSESMKDLLNQRVKHRENFRPFAPSCLEKYVKDFFDLPVQSPYMLLTASVKKKNSDKLKAIIHKDGSSRIQTVNNKDNDRYYDLINEFYKLSKIPVVLNTSFNNKEPIVETPADAISTFLGTDIDYLAIGDFLAWKEKN